MKFRLSRVTPNDLDELIALQFHAFSGLDFHDALFGPNTPAMRLRAKKGILKDMAEDAADVWLKITNGDTGRIVCGANWKVYPTYVSSTSEGKHGLSVDWYEGEEKEMAEFLVKDFTERRRGYCKEAHVVLSILFTDPEYQRLGAGSMMVKWGCDLADHLFLPVWVEGSEKGHELYLQNGFEDVENVNTQTKKMGVALLYDAKASEGIDGGGEVTVNHTMKPGILRKDDPVGNNNGQQQYMQHELPSF